MEALVVLESDRQWIAVLLRGDGDRLQGHRNPVCSADLADGNGSNGTAGVRGCARAALAVGVATVAPFLTDYAVRRGLHVFRGYEVAGPLPPSCGRWGAPR